MVRSRAARCLRLACAPLLLGAALQANEASGGDCTHYASPTGGGNGSSPSSPFRVSRFWALARPGMSLCLLDGVYKGADSMITPPHKLSGSSERPLMIKALHDGKVLIDGESGNRPVYLEGNDWITIEGINACCSSRTVIEIAHSTNDTIRRVAAWDALDGNEKIFGIHYSSHTLLEDVAGWGTGRKIFESSYAGDFTTIRRAWGRWERSTVAGPKMVYSLTYNNYNMLIENSIGTWSGEKMPATYVLRDYYGKPSTGPHAGTYKGDEIEQAQGIFSIDGVPEGALAHARLLGSLAYILPTDTFKYTHLIFVTKVSGIQIDNTVAYYPPETDATKITFGLYQLADGSDPVEDVATNITGFGGFGPTIKHGWAVRNQLHGATPRSTYQGPESVFNTSRGAQLCHRYKDGALTNEPLWPWPMNQRIIDAMIQSGRGPVDITAAVEQMFGPVPSPCRAAPVAAVTP